MSLLALLRHGPTRWTAEHRLQGRTDLPLSPEGRETVGRWRLILSRPAGEIAGFRWITSPLRRTRETATLLGHGDAPVDARLIEMSFGAWEGRLVAELRAEMASEMTELEDRGLDFRPPDGETPRDVQARIRPFLAEIAGAGEDLVAVTHKSVIRAIFSLATGWPMRGDPPCRLAPFALHIFALGPDGTPRPHRLNLPLEVPG